MTKQLQKNIQQYREAVYKNSPVTEAYFALIHFVRKLRADLMKTAIDYSVGNVSEGYMDFTYFPFANEHLQEKQLRFGIVLNHHDMRFELWLMARNAEGKTMYWDRLKSTSWNADKTVEPQYSVLESIICGEPDFSDLDVLSTEIIDKAMIEAREIIKCL